MWVKIAGGLAVLGVVLAGLIYIQHLRGEVRDQEVKLALKQAQITAMAEEAKVQSTLRAQEERAATERQVLAQDGVDRMRALDDALASPDRKAREDRIRDARPTLWLRIINRQHLCILDNVGRRDGECVAGFWKAKK